MGINTFQDDKSLQVGDFISKELSEAIEKSQVALIIFSKNYAESGCCLSELVKIIECKEKNGQTVIPIFHDVDPSHVRKQKESFAKAFAEHESNYKNDVDGMQKLQGWRTALTAAADLKGYDIHDMIESEKIQEIVDDISSICKSARSSYFLQVVGINAHLENLKSLLQIEINDVRVLGIWGVGGIGKTTIANALFDTLSYQFKGACFLEDVREDARKNGLHSLQNILLSELLRKKDDYVNNKHKGKSMIPKKLSSMKVLIVLDDIDHGDHLEYLAGDVRWFGDGSRVIVTTRDLHLIKKYDAIYKVPILPDHEAMHLFNKHAFIKEVPDECFKELSLEVVDHAKGLPLALKVWGSFLYTRNITEWRSAIEKMKTTSKSEIVEKLKISYDGLDDTEKNIFLDIACFFRGYEKDEIMPILESCYSGANVGLSVLIDKSLVFISKSEYGKVDTIQMHDLIEDMGKYIVNMQKNPGERSRLWDVEDIEEVMVNNTGTMAVEEIWVPFGQNLPWKEYAKAMKNMQKLRMLRIDSYTKLNNTQLKEYAGSIEYLPNNLRLFIWEYYPWQLLPQNFNPTKLVHLELQHSSLHHLWDETKHLPYLRRLDLSGSRHLKRTPDFMGMPNLEYLDLSACESLEEVHHSLELPCLRRLDLSGSECLKRTPDFTGMPNLEYLDLSICESLEEVHHSLGCSRKLVELNLCGCEKLKRFPCVNVESLKSLNLEDCSSLQKLPEFRTELNLEIEIIKLNLEIEIGYHNIHLQPHLKELDLSGIDILVALPSFICKLKCLVKLDVSGCSKLECLPEEIADLENLEVLDASDTLISRPPSSIIWLNKLKVVTFAKEASEDEVHSEESEDGAHFVFPEVNEGLLSLEQLDLRYCNLIDGGLPEDIGSLSSLKQLDLRGNKFKYLPRSIAQLGALQNLNLSRCNKLKELPCFTGMPNLDILNLSYCNLIDGGLPEDIGSLSSLRVFNLRGNKFEHLPRSIAQLGALQSLDLSHCGELKELPGFTGMPNLDALDLSYCNLIDGGLPEDIGCLSSLKVLNLSENNFEHLPRSIAQLGALQSLYLSHCGELKELPGFTGMPNLDALDLSYCNLIDGGLPEDIGCLSSLKVLNLNGNNFERLPQSIAQLGALRILHLSDCKRLKELPKVVQQLDTIDADWRNDWICNSLFQNISSLQHDISASGFLSLRVFSSCWMNIPSWFPINTSVSVNLPVNWYVPDNFLGFAVCYLDSLVDDITAHLIHLCNDGTSRMTQNFSLSKHNSEYYLHFLLVPLAGLWDESKANGKTPNDYGYLRLFSTGKHKKWFEVRLLYKDEPKLQIGMKRSRDEEGSCSSSKKQRSQVQVPLLQLFPTSLGL